MFLKRFKTKFLNSLFGKNIISFSIVLCLLFGMFFHVQIYKASESDYFTYDELSAVLYYKSGNDWILLGDARDTFTLSTSYKHFRLVTFLPRVYSSGSVIDFSGYLGFSGGNFSSPYAYFANSATFNPVSQSIACSVINNSTFSGFGSKLNSSSHVLLMEFFINDRTASNIHIAVNRISVNYNSPLENIMQDEVKASNSILDNIKGMFTSLVNLPTNFSGFFSNVVTAVSNLPTNLSVFFSNVVTSVTNLPSKLSGFFSNVVTAVSNLPTNLSGFFSNIGDKIDSFMTLFNYSGGGGGHSIDGTPLEQATAELNELRDALRADNVSGVFDDLGQYVPNSEHFLVRVYTMIFENQLVHNIVYLSLIFGVMSYLLFGKR